MAVRVYTGQFVIGDLPTAFPLQFMALSAAGTGVTGLAAAFTVRRTFPAESAAVDISGSVTIIEESAANFPGLYTMYLDPTTAAGEGSLALRITNAGIDDVVLIITKLPREGVLVA